MAKDPLTLARAVVTCFNETPLDVAAMLGHLDFANYLLTHKPDMTKAVDLRGVRLYTWLLPMAMLRWLTYCCPPILTLVSSMMRMEERPSIWQL